MGFSLRLRADFCTYRSMETEPMNPVAYTELRQNLARWMDRAVADRAPILVTRQGSPSVVMMSLEEFEGWVETVHLLRSPRNAERLLRAAAEADRGETAGHDLPPA
jgi:antitoxin YefM